jgi:integrase
MPRLRPSEHTGKIISTLIKLKSRGLAQGTLRNVAFQLKHLAKSVDVDSPAEVKAHIANKKCANSYKANLVKAYNYYAVANGLQWIRPIYKWERKIPRIPTTNAINKIIASASQRYATILRLLAETGAMPHELAQTTLKDIDLDRGLLNIRGYKGHLSRVFKLKQKTLAMLKIYLSKNQGTHPFPKSTWICKCYRELRNRLATKLNDPTIRQIRLYDFRHYFATMLYHKTKDILHVKQQLGHKKLETTLIYTQIVDFGEDEFTSAIARNLKEACQLIESGFEYVTEIEGAKLFRKRK